MTCQSKFGLRTLASVLLPAMLGGCACFTPALKAVDAAMTAAIPSEAPPRASPARVKGFSHVAPETKSSPRPAHARPAPRREKPKREIAPTNERDAAAAVDEADAAAVTREAERLAAVETAARAASEKAVAEAHAMMLKGEVQAARQRLVAAMNGSNALVVLAFARTFDPIEIAKLAKADAQPDATRALALYEHARQLGSKAAEEALKRLAASQPKVPASVPSPAAPAQPPAESRPAAASGAVEGR